MGRGESPLQLVRLLVAGLGAAAGLVFACSSGPHDFDENTAGAAGSGECANGDSRDCGTDEGDCVKGTQTCANETWGDCVGEVEPATTDTCDEGNDANCNGSANEGCNCTAGETRGCAKCGTQTCGANGKWSSTCAGSKECEPGDVKTGSVDCGYCGTQSTEQICSSSCSYGPAQNVGSCSGSGCEPGSTQPETVQPCGYCGEQERQRVCDEACQLGPIVDKGICKQNECSLMPGDERVGYVVCIHPAPHFNTVCLPSQKCCLSTQGSQECKADCDATDKYSPCDGPEDCGGSICCSRYDPNENTYAYCTTDCEFLARCHADSDCPVTWHCSKYSSGSYANGVCYSQGSNP